MFCLNISFIATGPLHLCKHDAVLFLFERFWAVCCLGKIVTYRTGSDLTQIGLHQKTESSALLHN